MVGSVLQYFFGWFYFDKKVKGIGNSDTNCVYNSNNSNNNSNSKNTITSIYKYYNN